MMFYVDSSVVLRVILKQPGSLKEWPRIQTGVTSAILEVECMRTLDRLLMTGTSSEEVAKLRQTAFRVMKGIDLVELSKGILSQAAQPLPTALGTLDAIHLATAMLWRQQYEESLIIATHDKALALASRAVGFEVIGS
ncbi:MAG TPA: type II toxin-antitoxin system VapC family toxin [Thermoanaerobaculia bacterium]|nr:type II toxin-antitoxin system VapC family toxin [Thermoanaerobaculia bacterium]